MNYPRMQRVAILSAVVVFLFAWFALTANAQVVFPARGGTGTSTVPTLGQLLMGQSNGTYAPQATSTLGISTTNIIEGAKLFFTDARVASYLTSSTTLPSFLNYWTKSGNDLVYTAGNIGIADGSAALPSLAFSSQPTLGFHSPATNQLALSIAGITKYKFTGTGIELTSDKSLSFRSASNGSQGASDTYLFRNAASFLEMRDGTTANQFGVYNTYTSASQYERAIFGFQQNTNVLSIGTQAAGTGTVRNIALIGGNVGIGTTSPSSMLHLAHASALAITLSHSPTYTTTINSALSASEPFSITTVGVKHYKYNSVDNSVNIGGTGNTIFRIETSAAAAPQIRFTGASGVDTVRLVAGSGSTSNLGFYTSSVEAMRLNNAGNLGIGTITPTGGLDVSDGSYTLTLGADNFAKTRTNATTKISRFGAYHYTNAEEPVGLFLSSVGATNALLTVGGGSSLMNAATQIDFYTAANNTTVTGTSRMTILSSGNVGVGTTNPLAMFTVGGSQSGNAGLEVIPGSGIVIQSYNRTAGAYASISYDGSSLNFRPNGTSQLFADANGVGIGNTGPTSLLHLGTTFDNDAVTPTLSFGDGDTGFYESADDQLQLSIAGTQKFAFLGTRLTSQNGAAFSTSVSSATTPVFIPTTGALTAGLGGSGGDVSLITAGVSRLYATAAGNLGIGTTTPSHLVDLFSTGTTTMRLDSNSATQGSCLVMKDSDGGGYTYVTSLDGVLSASVTPCS